MPTLATAPAQLVALPPEPVPLLAITPAPTPPVSAAAPAPPPATPVPAAPKPVAPSAIRYVKPPVLNFPPLSRRAREQGTVVLRIVVDVNGRLKEARVHTSSGFERIDQAALSDIRSARFQPHMDDGMPVEISTTAALGYDL